MGFVQEACGHAELNITAREIRSPHRVPILLPNLFNEICWSHRAMKTPPMSFVLFAVAAFFGALGQYLYKTGADRSGNTVAGYLLNARLLGGVVCYVLVMVLFVAGFKRGGSMAALYPVYASTFIWGAVIAWLALGNPIKPVHVGGMALLVAGMYLMGS